MALKTYTGSCHCGAIRYEADIDLAAGSMRCNCSYCAKVRIWFAFARGAERLRVLDGSGITAYRWTPPGADQSHLAFMFCRVCGVRTFARGELEALGGTFHAVSVPTLDLSLEERVALPVTYVNGREGRYDQVPAHPEAM